MSFCTWIIQISTPGENIAVDACTTINLHGHFFLQVHLNDEDPNLQELLQAGRGGILMEDFVKYSLDMKLLDVQVFESMT